MKTSRIALLCALWLLPACSTEAPYETAFDQSGGTIDVEVLGDGFVRSGNRRLPLDLLVLELRQRMRTIDDGLRDRIVVRLKVAPGIVAGPQAKVAREGLNRLIDELGIMDVGQVVVL